jgi:serine/threonine protein kinase
LITQLENALRVPLADDGSNYYMLEHQTLVMRNPQYMAPELWKDEKQPFDGYAVDLWSAGVILLAMLFGFENLFVAPVPEDRTFQQICVHEHLKDHVRKRKLTISDDALDLLQRMLRINPNDRLTLTEVEEHSWLKSS